MARRGESCLGKRLAYCVWLDGTVQNVSPGKGVHGEKVGAMTRSGTIQQMINLFLLDQLFFA